MKVCDSCFYGTGKNVPAVLSMMLGPETYDLCASCADQVRQIIAEGILDQTDENIVNLDGKKKRGRKTKTYHQNV